MSLASDATVLPTPEGDAIFRKVQWRVVAPLAGLIVLSSLDRTNVSLAALHMNADIGLDARAYGFGASIFFVGYLLCQLPSMAVLRRIGPRLWIGISVIGWGLCATSMAFVHNPMHFYVARFLLGVFESGFAPGVVWYVSQWLPPAYRSRSIGLTLLAIPTSVIFGSPLTGSLMKLDLLGMAGWRAMFLTEGLVTVAAGIAAMFWFVDRPAQARWLAPTEQGWIAASQPPVATDGPRTPYSELLSRGLLWRCALLWFVLVAGSNAIIFWLPTAIHAAGATDTTVVGLLSALPWIAIGLGMWLGAKRSDLTGNRAGLVAWGAAGAAVLFAISGIVGANAAGLASLVIGCLGLGIAQGIYWAIPTAFDFGRDARAIATINLIGNLNGVVVPAGVGMIVAATGSLTPPLLALAVLLAASAAAAWSLKPKGPTA